MANSNKLETSIKEEIEMLIKKEEKDAIDNKGKLEKDFLYGFSWYSEGLYKSLYLAMLYKEVLSKEQKEDDLEIISKRLIAYWTKQILDGFLSVKSSCGLSNMKSIWELECQKEFVKQLGYVVDRASIRI